MVMDHVIRQRLNEIRQKQLDAQKNSQEPPPAPFASDKSYYIPVLAGVAAGITIAIMAWIVASLFTADDAQIPVPESRVSMDTSEISKANEQIERLNDRLQLLTQTVISLESRLNRLTGMAGSGHDAGLKPTHSYQNHIAEAAGTGTTTDENGLAAPGGALPSKTGKSFIPTHNVTTSLNLRPFASLDSTPVTTLSSGTKIEYIHESGTWYYVNTEQHGKGWCASEYLSPLQPSSTSPQHAGQED
jgi:hypothetical protein